MNNNLILIGLPASGKTTLGKNISKKINCKFFDLDYEVEKKYNDYIYNLYKSYTTYEISLFFIEMFVELNTNNSNSIIATTGYFPLIYSFEEDDDTIFLNISLQLFYKRLKEIQENCNIKENLNRSNLLKINDFNSYYTKRYYIYKLKSKYIYSFDSIEELKEIEDNIIYLLKNNK